MQSRGRRPTQAEDVLASRANTLFIWLGKIPEARSAWVALFLTVILVRPARYFIHASGLMPGMPELLHYFRGVLLGAFLGGLVLSARGDEPGGTDWCAIQGPREVSVNQPFDVMVQLKGLHAKTKLAVDL
jgi:hypothetical protein